MIGVFLWFIEVPNGGLLAVGIPLVFGGILKGIQHRLVHLLVITPPKHEGVFHPDASRGVMKPRVHTGTKEVHLLRIRMEAVKSPAIGEVLVKILKCRQQKDVELFCLHAVVLDF